MAKTDDLAKRVADLERRVQAQRALRDQPSAVETALLRDLEKAKAALAEPPQD